MALADAATLAPEVRDHEPHTALFGGADGLDIYRALLRASRDVIAADGRLILELGYNQSADVVALARAAGWEAGAARKDLQGIERALTLRPVTKDR